MLSKSNSVRLLFLFDSEGLRLLTPSLLSMLVLFRERSKLSRSDFFRSALDIDFFGLRIGFSIGDDLVGRLYLGRDLSLEVSVGFRRRVPDGLSFSGWADRLEQQSDCESRKAR